MHTTTITITGTHCHSCKALIEEVCREIPGVIDCTVNFITGETVIKHNGPLDLEQLGKEIASLGNYQIKK